MLKLYTIGHREHYRGAIREHGPIRKAPGGFAFHSPDAARAWLRAHGGYAGHPPEAFAVFEIVPVEIQRRGDCWEITRDSPIIREVEE